MPTDTSEFRYASDWGPWVPHATGRERLCAAVVVRLLSSIVMGRTHPLTRALRRAEDAGDDALGMFGEALAEAALELERLPALPRRKLMCSYGNHQRRDSRERPERRGRHDTAESKGVAA